MDAAKKQARRCTENDPCEMCAWRFSEGQTKACGGPHGGAQVGTWKLYLQRQSPTACDPVKVQESLRRLHGA